MPEVIHRKLQASRLSSDPTKSQLDVLQTLTADNNIIIETYPTYHEGTVDVLLIQHDALATFPGTAPYMRDPYTQPNGLHTTRTFIFSVAGYAANSHSLEANKHVVTHLPVVIPADAGYTPPTTRKADTPPTANHTTDNDAKKNQGNEGNPLNLSNENQEDGGENGSEG
jgi:hypothetical protein